MSLRDITRFVVAHEFVEQTETALREAGHDRLERFVLWSGIEEGGTFRIHSAHVPEQTAYRTDGGLLVEVKGPALHRLNVWLHEHGEVLGVQIHSHPREAYHSETDDTFPIVTELGALSIVVPDFCRQPFLRSELAVYRLSTNGWELMTNEQVSRLLLLN